MLQEACRQPRLRRRGDDGGDSRRPKSGSSVELEIEHESTFQTAPSLNRKMDLEAHQGPLPRSSTLLSAKNPSDGDKTLKTLKLKKLTKRWKLQGLQISIGMGLTHKVEWFVVAWKWQQTKASKAQKLKKKKEIKTFKSLTLIYCTVDTVLKISDSVSNYINSIVSVCIILVKMQGLTSFKKNALIRENRLKNVFDRLCCDLLLSD
jgi:hypothetical protein